MVSKSVKLAVYIVPTEDVRQDANSVSGKPHGSGSNATNKSCETLCATLRGESVAGRALVFMCQNRHISDALLNIKSGGGCMPYLRFAAAAPRIKHTNARGALSLSLFASERGASATHRHGANL